MKNKGYTLIEIVVVVAIIAAMTVTIWQSVNAIFGLDMRRCAADIVAAMEKTKVQQLTKQGDSWLRLYRTEDGVYLDIYESGTMLTNEFKDGNKIGRPSVNITYTMSDNTAGTLDDTGIVIAFNRSNGSFLTAGESWALHNQPANLYTPPNPDAYYVSIELQSGGTDRTITIYPNTGKFVLG